VLLYALLMAWSGIDSEPLRRDQFIVQGCVREVAAVREIFLTDNLRQGFAVLT
jgi:hypothetical protein